MLSSASASSAANRRRQLWRLRAAIFCFITAFGLMVSFEGIWMKSNGVDEGTIGVLGSVSRLLAFITGLLWGNLADRTNRPHLIAMVGFVLMAITVAFLGYATHVIQYTLYAVALGLVVAMVQNMVPLMAVSLFDQASAGKGYASYRIFGSAGWLAGCLGGPLILNEPQHMIFLAAVILLLGTITMMGFTPEATQHKEYASPFEVLRNRPLVGLFIAMFFFAFAIPALFRFAQIYAEQLGGSEEFVGLFMGINGLVALVALPFAGVMIDRFGTRLFIWLALIAQPIRVFSYSLITENHLLMLLPQSLHFFTWAGLEVASVLFVTRNAKPGNRATALAMLMGVQTVGAVLGATLCGYLAEHFGYPVMFRTASGVTLIALLLFAGNELRCRLTHTPEDDSASPDELAEVAASPSPQSPTSGT